MGTKQDQALTDRIVREMIARHDIHMIYDRRKESTRVYLDFTKRNDLYIEDAVAAKDLWEDGNVRNLIVNKIGKLKSSTLGQIAFSDNGQSSQDGWRTRCGEVETLRHFGAAGDFGSALLYRVASLVVAARMYDILVRTMEPIEAHEDVPDQHPH